MRVGARTPVLAGVDDGPVTVDVDDTVIEVHGHAKQGAGFGYSGVRGLNALLATVTTGRCARVPQTAPTHRPRRVGHGGARLSKQRHEHAPRHRRDHRTPSPPTVGIRSFPSRGDCLEPLDDIPTLAASVSSTDQHGFGLPMTNQLV